jgi:hypothetical protein
MVYFVMELVEVLASKLVLGALLDEVRTKLGSYELLEHWTQGEFHHDLVLRLPETPELDARILVVATNCNGGVKEVLLLADLPDRDGLWSFRCPKNPEFAGPRPLILARSVTAHWFDPCELLAADARSEYLPDYRERQRGGGWTCTAKKG